MVLDNYNTLDQQNLNNNIPLIYSIIENHIYDNVILIHDKINNSEQFALYANSKSLSIIYNESSSNDELMQVLNKHFTTIKRIAFVFHTSNTDGLKEFTNNKLLFDFHDLEINIVEYSLNMQFIINIANKFNVQNLDYLACNTLLFENWNKYFNVLKEKTKATIGASNNLTGNIKYGGDWILENTNEDIRNIYFNDDVENYQYIFFDYLLLYNSNGGTGSIEPQYYSLGDPPLTIKDSTGFTNPGSTFSKWNTQENGSGTNYNPGDTITPPNTLTLYAVWIDGVQAAADAANEGLDAANAATDAANAAAEAADAATAAAQDAADAVAALSAEVTSMVNALKKQITALTNLVIKIQKKVRA